MSPSQSPAVKRPRPLLLRSLQQGSLQQGTSTAWCPRDVQSAGSCSRHSVRFTALFCSMVPPLRQDPSKASAQKCLGERSACAPYASPMAPGVSRWEQGRVAEACAPSDRRPRVCRPSPLTSHADDVSLQALEPSHGLATAAFSLKSP